MKNLMKSELVNDVLTGLMVAAAFAAAMPADAFAQLSAQVAATKTEGLTPFVTAASYVSYGLGTFLTVQGIAAAKKHADQPGQNPLGPALGKIGAGAAFLAAPGLIGTIQSTGTTVFTGTGGSQVIGN